MCTSSKGQHGFKQQHTSQIIAGGRGGKEGEGGGREEGGGGAIFIPRDCMGRMNNYPIKMSTHVSSWQSMLAKILYSRMTVNCAVKSVPMQGCKNIEIHCLIDYMKISNF